MRIRFAASVLFAVLVAGCGSGGSMLTPSSSAAPSVAAPSSAETSAAPMPSLDPTPDRSAAPSSTATPGSGHVIHVNLYVPLAAKAKIGAACDAAALTATGPKSATIPGSRMEFLAVDRVNGTFEPIGAQPVPLAGSVAEAISDDPMYPAACQFSFDVSTTSDPDFYAFRVGSVYFPVPAIPRSQLEAAGWVTNIGVNPQ
jgi:hypothetical protein